jgi:hypothetical protein
MIGWLLLPAFAATLVVAISSKVLRPARVRIARIFVSSNTECVAVISVNGNKTGRPIHQSRLNAGESF